MVSAALIVWVTRKVNWADLTSVLGHVSPKWAAAGSVLTGALITLLSVRWSIFLTQQAMALPFRSIFLLTWAGQFFNSVLPGSTGGDFVKIYQVCKLIPGRRAAAASTVLIDRLSALAALAVLAGGALISEPAPLQALAGHTPPISWVIGAAALVLVGGAILFRVLRPTLWFGRLQRTLAAVGDCLAPSWGLCSAVALSFAIHCLSFLTVFSFARSLGIGITYLQTLQILPVVLILVLLPVTINGHGLREVALIYFFTHLHIGIGGNPAVDVREAVVALSILVIANDLLWSVPGGLAYMFRFKR